MYQPVFRITPYLLRLVTQAVELKVEIERSAIQLAWIPQLQKENAIKLAHFSTAIEGNTLSLSEVEALSRGGELHKDKKTTLEVLNHLEALKWVWKQKKGSQISEKNLLYLHKLLTKNILNNARAGKYKLKPNRIVDAKGVTIYIPPGPEQVRTDCIELLTWLEVEGRNQHPIIASAIAHHRLVSIHPFSDGNGRVSRALGVWILFNRGFDTHHLLSLDEYFEKGKNDYYNKIQQARDLDGDLTYWIEYTTLAVVETFNIIKKRIISLQMSTSTTSIRLTKNQELILQFIRDHGSVRSPLIQKHFKISRARVAQIIKPLVGAGLLIRDGQTRNTQYRLK